MALELSYTRDSSRFRATTAPTSISRTSADPSPAFALETPPATGDFDWDERMAKPNDVRFIDGMASLPEERARGYMGVASGAALLRLTDPVTTEGEDNGQEADQQEATNQTLAIQVMSFSIGDLEPFIDAYFSLYHVSYPIVHEATFRAQVMDIIPRPKNNGWNVLLYVIAALGAFTASETAPEIDLALFKAAKAQLTIDMLETGNIVLVQALTLISNYVQKRNKPNSGYNYLGLAKRMAMGIGLHKEFPAWRTNPLMLENRRRVWWCLYIFDVGATITFSRPLDLPSDGIEVELPLNVHDSDITPSTRKWPSEAQFTTLYTHVRCQASFHLATSPIYSRVISSSFPTAEEMLKLDDANLATYLASIPPWFQEDAPQLPKFRLSHAILQWRCRNFRILMYRPYLMRRFMLKERAGQQPFRQGSSSSSDEFAIQRCLFTAAETVQLITGYWRNQRQNVMACWYSLYFLFQATLIPVVCLRNEPYSGQAVEWRDQILNALEVIVDMARLNPAASRCHWTINNLCGAYLAQDVAQWDAPTEESPQTQLNALYSFTWPMADASLDAGFDLAMQESTTQDFLHQLSAF